MDPVFHATIVSLLCSLFDAASLRRFLRRGEQGTAIARELPGPEASLTHVADIAVEQLHQRGLVNATLARLRHDFPGRATEVLATFPAGPLMVNENTQIWRPTGLRLATIRSWKTELKRGASSPRFVGACLVIKGAVGAGIATALTSVDLLPEFFMGLPMLPQLAIEFAGLIGGAMLWLWPSRTTIMVVALYLLLNICFDFFLFLAHLQAVEVMLTTMFCFEIPLFVLLFKGPRSRRRAELLCLLLLYYAVRAFIGLTFGSLSIALTGEHPMP